MTSGVMVSDPDDWTAKAILSGFLNQGKDAVFINLSELSASVGEKLSFKVRGIDLTDLEAIVVRDMGRSGPHDLAFRFEASCILESLGIPIINPPSAIERAANKFATTVALHLAGVPEPRTTVTTDLESAMDAIREYKSVVSKPLCGYKGKGLALLGEDDSEKVSEILKKQGVVYLQEFHRSNRDIRVFVIGEEVAGAIYRFAPSGEWISNLARGGRPEPCVVTEEIAKLAVRANAAVGAVYSGVDLIETLEGLKVLEVNGTPSGRGIYLAWGVDVGEMIARHVVSKLR